MLKITEKYYLDSDTLNIMLLEKKIYLTGKHEGEEYFENIGYFGNVQQLYISLLDKEIREDLPLLENIKKINEIRDSLREFNKEYNKKGE